MPGWGRCDERRLVRAHSKLGGLRMGGVTSVWGRVVRPGCKNRHGVSILPESGGGTPDSTCMAAAWRSKRTAVLGIVKTRVLPLLNYYFSFMKKLNSG